MSKIALITDTHYGIRNDNQIFLDKNKKFFDNFFFKEIDEQGIKHVIHLGDLVDRRKFINFNTARHLRKDFIEPLIKRNIDYHQILGNHDVYYKNTNDVNAIEELYAHRLNYYHEPKELQFFGKSILLLPWICDENREMSMAAINNTKATICMGHLQITGFQMQGGNICNNGENIDLFDRFDFVFSGHFHVKSHHKNIYYLGSHSQFIWSDYNNPRGFHIFDTKNNKLTFYENPYKMFTKLFYDDKNKEINQILDYDFAKHKDTYVKIIIKSKQNPYYFDKFYNKLEEVQPIDIQIVEENVLGDFEEDIEKIVETQNPIEMLRWYINHSNVQNPKKYESIISELYKKAIEME